MDEPDVAVVGSGVAGALVAWRLARAGLRVLILEAGPPVVREEAVAAWRATPGRPLDAPYPPAPYAPFPGAADLDRHYLQDGPDLFVGLYLRRVGGSTWHWLGTALRMLPADFAIASRHGVGTDWPLGYEDLEPWYCEAEEALGVAGEGDLGSPRSRPLPMPPLPAAPVDEVVAEALKALGHRLDRLPQARNSVAREGRPACCGAASCVPVCPTGAKYDATVHVALAAQAGACLEDRAVVHRLEAEPGGPITAVRWRTPDRVEHEVRPRVVVVAAHAVETPRLLLASRTPALPEGVANSSGLVGRCLMGGPAVLSQALAPRPVRPYGAPQATSGLMAFRDGPFRRERAAFVLAVATDGWADGAPDRLASQFIRRGLRGRLLREALTDHVQRQVALVSTCEEVPDPENRVTVAFDRPDALGIPRPRIRYRVSEHARAGAEQARTLHERIFEAMGASERRHGGAADPGYLFGTCRMGIDPLTSVVDPDLRSHDHPNLYLVGSAVFPGLGATTPTLTVAALALRTAERIRRRFQAGSP